MSFDPDDLAYFGPSRPSGDEVSDPRARVGRLTPLPLKLDGAYGGVPLGMQMLPVSAAAVGLTVPNGAMSATVQVQGNPVRYTFEGTTPTAAIGLRADANNVLVLTLPETLYGAQFIREGGADATLAVTYWS